MKIKAGETQIVIGKRVTIGAAINGIATAVAAYFPEHAVAIMATAIPLTFLIQVVVAHYGGVTQ